jgi:hypothetical protein
MTMLGHKERGRTTHYIAAATESQGQSKSFRYEPQLTVHTFELLTGNCGPAMTAHGFLDLKNKKS